EAAVEKAQKARQDKEAEALNGLYAALEPAQRKAVAAAIRAKHTEREGKHAAPNPKQRLEHLTKQIDLDAGPQKKVEALLSKDKEGAEEAAHQEMKKHAEAVLAAFEGDGFDAKKLEVPPGAGKKGMAAHVQFLGALLPILKPEQRDKLVAAMVK